MSVIPAKAGIQWLLRNARLDPGSALRAVRDDEGSGQPCAIRNGIRREERAHLSVIPAQAGIQWLLRNARLAPGSALARRPG